MPNRPSCADARGELDALFQLRDAAVRGRGGTVIVHGETGTGRTTLLAAVAAAGADEFTVLTTRGYEPERSLRRAGLHRLLRPMLARLTRREVASLEAASGANPPTIGRAVLRSLSEAARERPVLCCIDDAHWLDPDSLDVLARLSRRIDNKPIAMVLTS